MRAACLSLSAPSPARRPLRLALSALSPPSLSSATHLFTARRLALNKFAASTCLIPSRTAFTTCRRSMCCAAGLSFLASSRLFMQALTHHALFGARISKSPAPFTTRAGAWHGLLVHVRAWRTDGGGSSPESREASWEASEHAFLHPYPHAAPLVRLCPYQSRQRCPYRAGLHGHASISNT